jgi:hypothetical protein
VREERIFSFFKFGFPKLLRTLLNPNFTHITPTMPKRKAQAETQQMMDVVAPVPFDEDLRLQEISQDELSLAILTSSNTHYERLVKDPYVDRFKLQWENNKLKFDREQLSVVLKEYNAAIQDIHEKKRG